MKTYILILSMFLSSALLAQTITTNEIWVSPVGTDNTGNGTAANPFVRSSATSFDALMGLATDEGFTGVDAPVVSPLSTNTTIHLMAGTFKTHGYMKPLAGWKIRGAGIDVTIVQQQPWIYPFSLTNGWVIQVFEADGVARDGVEISDMTIDCNLQSSTFVAGYGAIGISGSNDKISRVKAINWGANNGGECFVFGIGSYWDRILTNDLIEDCVVGSPAHLTFPNGADGFVLLGLETTNYLSLGWIENGEIRNCVIDDVPTGTNAGQLPYFHGCGGCTVYGFKATGNRFYNIDEGFYSSCGSVYNWDIENNQFINVNIGIYFPASDACATNNFLKNNVQINNNLITVNSNGIGLDISGYGQSGNVGTNFVISGNNIHPNSSASISAAQLGYLYQAVFQNNVLDANGGGPYGLGFSSDTNTTFASLKNNLSDSGQDAIPGEDETITFIPTSGPGWYRLTPAYQASAVSGNITIARAPGSDNTMTDTELNYYVMGYNTNPRYVGTINMLRSLQYQPGSVEAARIGCVAAGSQVYLDIYVGSDPDNLPITIKAHGGFGSGLTGDEPIYLQTPLYMGTTNMPWASKTLWFSRGLSTSDNFYAGTNGVQLNDDSGLILDTALNIVDPTHGGLGVNASGWGAGLVPYTTGTGTFGSAPVSSFGLSLINDANSSSVLTSLGLPNVPATIVTNTATGVTLSGSFSGNGSGLTGITAQQVGAASSTNAVVWNSLTVTNSGATNWATLSVTPSNAVISVKGITVAVLQTNGILNAYNGLSTTVSNTTPASAVLLSLSGSLGVYTAFWTNTTAVNIAAYIVAQNGGTSLSYNGSLLVNSLSTNCVTTLMQPNSYLSFTNRSPSGSVNLNWHPF